MYINQYYTNIYKLEPFPKAEMQKINRKKNQLVWAKNNKDKKKTLIDKWRKDKVQYLRDYQNNFYKNHKKERSEYYKNYRKQIIGYSFFN
tara:strand:- start:956 stop:1225 length:270 start_codon:yes stop_codon:yes gene_type:complete